MSQIVSWMPVLFSGVFVGAAAVGLLLALRERSHRGRVHQLTARLEELERLGVSVTDLAGDDAPNELGGVDVRAPRGWLSTVVSSLLRQVERQPQGPARLDLRAVAYVQNHLDEVVSHTEMVSELCVSARTLQRRLANDLGCTPRDLVVAVKMHAAKKMLQTDDAVIQEVSRAVGFDDPYHFSRRFKAYYGVPPSQVRQGPSAGSVTG